jgi:hypothetical protein
MENWERREVTSRRFQTCCYIWDAVSAPDAKAKSGSRLYPQRPDEFFRLAVPDFHYSAFALHGAVLPRNELWGQFSLSGDSLKSFGAGGCSNFPPHTVHLLNHAFVYLIY